MVIPASLVHSCLVSPPTSPLHPHPVTSFLQHNPSKPQDGQWPFSQPNWVLHSSPMFINGVCFCRHDCLSSHGIFDDGEGSIVKWHFLMIRNRIWPLQIISKPLSLHFNLNSSSWYLCKLEDFEDTYGDMHQPEILDSHFHRRNRYFCHKHCNNSLFFS